MTYSVLIFAYRKLGTTPEQFRAHYEGKHMPLVKEIGGEYVQTLQLLILHKNSLNKLPSAASSAKQDTLSNKSYPKP